MSKKSCLKTSRKELKLNIVDISIAEDVFNSFDMLQDGIVSEIKVSIQKWFIRIGIFYLQPFILRLETSTEHNIFGEEN